MFGRQWYQEGKNVRRAENQNATAGDYLRFDAGWQRGAKLGKADFENEGRRLGRKRANFHTTFGSFRRTAAAGGTPVFLKKKRRPKKLAY